MIDMFDLIRFRCRFDKKKFDLVFFCNTYKNPGLGAGLLHGLEVLGFEGFGKSLTFMIAFLKVSCKLKHEYA